MNNEKKPTYQSELQRMDEELNIWRRDKISAVVGHLSALLSEGKIEDPALVSQVEELRDEWVNNEFKESGPVSGVEMDQAYELAQRVVASIKE